MSGSGWGLGGGGVVRMILKSLVVVLTLAPVAAFGGTNVKPTLSIAAEERYDDDILLRDSATDAPVAAELMTKITPRVGVNLEQRTLEVDAWYSPDLQLRHFSGTVRLDHRGGLDFHKRLSRITNLNANVRIWRVSDPTSLPRMGVARTLSPVLYGTGELGLDSRLTQRLNGAVRYRFEGTKIFDAAYAPSQVHQPSAELWYALTERTALGPEYRFQYFIYGPTTAVAHAPAAAFRHRLTRFITFTARGGPIWYQQLDGKRSGLAPRAHLELSRYLDGFELGAQVGQDLVGATGFTDAVWAQYAGLYTAVRITEPLRVFGGAYWFRNGEAPGSTDEYFAAAAMTQGYAVGGGVEWRFNRHLVLQLQLDRVAQVGVLGPDGDLSRNVAAVRVVVTPF